MPFNVRCLSHDEDVEYEALEGKTYRHTLTETGSTKSFVCSFVAQPLSELTTIDDIDNERAAEKRLVVRYEWQTEKGCVESAVVTLPAAETRPNLGQEIIAHVPSLQARLHFSSPRDVAAAAAAFRNTEGFYIELIRYRQTGWRKDGRFGFPGLGDGGQGDLDATHMQPLAGYSLVRLPPSVDTGKVEAGARALLDVVSSAPPSVGGPLLGTMLAAPIYRRQDQLGARGFIALAVGPTQAGKTTLVSRLYCLLGTFYLKPCALETWFSTPATLEQASHFFRDLPLFVDDFRDTDRQHRETFRALAMSVGNAAARGRSTMASGGLRVARRFRPQCLVVATGEHAPEDDGGEEARVLEVDAARGIDSPRLLRLAPEELDAMPHLYRSYIEWCGEQSAESWAQRRSTYQQLLVQASAGKPVTRACENVATTAMGIAVFLQFLQSGESNPAVVADWQGYFMTFCAELPRLVKEQTDRIFASRIDGLVLSEVARGVRAREVIVSPLSAGARDKSQLGWWDQTRVYLRPDVTARWVSDRLRSGGRIQRPLSAKGVGAALRVRGGDTGLRVQKTIDRRREWVWLVERDHLGPEWDGLLDVEAAPNHRTPTGGSALALRGPKKRAVWRGRR